MMRCVPVAEAGEEQTDKRKKLEAGYEINGTG